MRKSPCGTARYHARVSATTPHGRKGSTKIRCNKCGIWQYVKLVNFFKNAGACDTCA